MASNLQLIFVEETQEENKSDDLYISAVLRTFFLKEDKNGEEVVINKVFLNGKQNYNDEKKLAHINNLKCMFSSNSEEEVKTKVIYFIDTDCYKKKFEEGSFFNNVCIFCIEKGFDLCWFSKNVEDVFLKRVANNNDDKTELAKNYIRDAKMEENIKKLPLNCKTYTKQGSNVFSVLDKYLKRK